MVSIKFVQIFFPTDSNMLARILMVIIKLSLSLDKLQKRLPNVFVVIGHYFVPRSFIFTYFLRKTLTFHDSHPLNG